MHLMEHATDVISRWSKPIGDFIPAFFDQSPALKLVIGHAAIILHGSTTLGIDDSFSDLDLWVIVPANILQQVEVIAGKRFFSFTLSGKEGHFNLEAIDEVIRRVRQCDMEKIAELRIGHLLQDVEENGQLLIDLARQPMTESVRRAWFFYHYVEMRGFHRSSRNPIERGHAIAILQALVPALDHALRAAMVLDHQPYPYIKWLAHAARGTPTGRRIVHLVEQIIDQLTASALQQARPERDHPISQKLRQIRQILIEAARASGIDEPWLDRWWEHIAPARAAIASIQW
jgi:hypothetical protein